MEDSGGDRNVEATGYEMLEVRQGLRKSVQEIEGTSGGGVQGVEDGMNKGDRDVRVGHITFLIPQLGMPLRQSFNVALCIDVRLRRPELIPHPQFQHHYHAVHAGDLDTEV